MTEEFDRCEVCGRRLDRPSFYGPCVAVHPAASEAEHLVDAIERAIHSRKGLGWQCCDEDVQEDIRQELLGLVRAHGERYESILEAPQVALFADGREPTTNERHLLNLLSWRQKEATEARQEVERLKRIAERLTLALQVFADVTCWKGPVAIGLHWTWKGPHPNPLMFARQALALKGRPR